MSGTVDAWVLGRRGPGSSVGPRVAAVNELGMRKVPVPRGFVITAEQIAALADPSHAVSGTATGLATATIGSFGLRAVARTEDLSTAPLAAVTTHHPVPADPTDQMGLGARLAQLQDPQRPVDALWAAGIGLHGLRGTAWRRAGAPYDEVIVFHAFAPRLPAEWSDPPVWRFPHGARVPRVGWRRRSAAPWLNGVRQLLNAASALIDEGWFGGTAGWDTWIEWCAPRRHTEIVDVRPLPPGMDPALLRDVML